MSGPTTVYSAAQRKALGLTDWPDTQPGFVNGEMTSSGNAGGTAKIKQRQFSVKGSKVLSRTSITNVPQTRGYDYVGGGPILAIGGLYLQTIHLENPLTTTGPTPFYTTVGLGLYSPKTRVTKYLGAIVLPQETLAQAKSNPHWTINIDTPNLISVSGWLYLQSTDFVYTLLGPAIHSLISVRARTADVLAAAKRGTVTTWRKYVGTDWTSPGLGGASTDIEAGQPMNWQANSYVDAAHGAILVVSPVSTQEIVISYNLPAGGWSRQQHLWSDAGKFDAYPTIVKVGTLLKIYYLQWQSTAQNWTTAVELSRTLVCA